MQELLDGAAARLWLKGAATQSSNAVDICSAYIKTGAMLSLFGQVIANGHKTRVLTRWNPKDLASGASDIDVYGVCRAHGVELYIHTSFHGKVYNFDPIGVLVGSFNLTGNGFSLNQTGNEEAGVLIPCTPATNSFIDELFSKATLLDEDLYAEMANFISTKENGDELGTEWPASIRAKLKINSNRVSKLLVSDCFHCSYEEFYHSQSFSRLHDLSLLGLGEHEQIDFERLSDLIRGTKLIIWLLEQLHENSGQLSFGQLTARLHNALFDDPKPYRKDVKSLVSNLISWLRAIESPEIMIDRTRYSERIRLTQREVKTNAR